MTVASLQFRGDSSPLTFDEMLSRFKRSGCNLLVTGEVSADVSAMATRRLLGAPFEDRKRILVLTSTDTKGVRAHLPGGCTPSDPDVHTVVRETEARAVTTRHGGSSTLTESVNPDLDELQRTVEAAIDRYAAEETLEPSELRLSMDSLYPLLVEYEYSEVVQFIRNVTERVTEANGMAHYHLPVPEGSETVESVGTLFDARVELRRNGPDAEQRWHVPTYGQETNWVRL